MLKLKLQYCGHPMRRLTHLKRLWCWDKLKAGGEGDDRRWDGWMVSLTQWTWVWVNSTSWRWTGRPGVLQSMGLQRVGHDWVTELNWTYHRANTFCNWHVSPARLGLPKAPTHILNQVCTHAQRSLPSIHKTFSEFWLQGDLHFSQHKGIKDTFILLSQLTPK